MVSRSKTIPWTLGLSIKSLICSSVLACVRRKLEERARRMSRNSSSPSVMIAMKWRSESELFGSLAGMALGGGGNRADYTARLTQSWRVLVRKNISVDRFFTLRKEAASQALE